MSSVAPDLRFALRSAFLRIRRGEPVGRPLSQEISRDRAAEEATTRRQRDRLSLALPVSCALREPEAREPLERIRVESIRDAVGLQRLVEPQAEHDPLAAARGGVD